MLRSRTKRYSLWGEVDPAADYHPRVPAAAIRTFFPKGVVVLTLRHRSGGLTSHVVVSTHSKLRSEELRSSAPHKALCKGGRTLLDLADAGDR